MNGQVRLQHVRLLRAPAVILQDLETSGSWEQGKHRLPGQFKEKGNLQTCLGAPWGGVQGPAKGYRPLVG